MKKMKAGGLFAGLLQAILLLWIVFPFFWAITSALKPADKLFTSQPQFLPSEVTLDNYRWAFTQRPFLLTLRNSIIISCATAVFAVSICVLFGYSLARYKYGGKKAVISSLIVSQMLPGVLIVIPIFVVFAHLRLVNTYCGLVLGFSTFAVPFTALLLRGFFANFPIELEEAAMIDGCSRFGAFFRVTLPLCIPGIVAVILFCFTLAWNDLLFAMVLTKDTKAMTVAVQLHNISTVQFAAGYWGGILAQGTVITIPVVILFVILQKYLVQGMTSGAIKA